MNEESMKKAQKLKDDLLADFPDIEKEMAASTELVYLTAGDIPLKRIIYASLMAGAALASARYRAARKVEDELRSKVMRKT